VSVEEDGMSLRGLVVVEHGAKLRSLEQKTELSTSPHPTSPHLRSREGA
jgi:hypothetical protein